MLRNQLTYVQVSNGVLDDLETIDLWLLGRQRLYEALLPTIGDVLPGIADIAHTIDLEPGPVYDAASFEGGMDAQAMIVAISCARFRQRPTPS